jgi:NTP pyrophosphatase (non-canonical NTP hydrolase)
MAQNRDSATIHDLQKRVAAFIDERDWRQFHEDPKGTLLALGAEVGELMEIYRWTTTNDAQKRSRSHQNEVEDEVADILYLLLMFCEENDINLEQAFARKEAKRAEKYPAAKSKGVNKKYTQL